MGAYTENTGKERIDIMKKSIWHTSSLLMSIVEILIGILLLIDPVGFTSGIIVCGGIVLTLMGVVSTVKYFFTKAEDAAKSGNLSKGILLTVLGLFCAFKSTWFLVTFPVITLLYGVIILVMGIAKLENAVNMLRLKHSYWFVALIGAVLSLIFAVLILMNPFASTTVLWSFIGISLLVEAVADIFAYFFARKE